MGSFSSDDNCLWKYQSWNYQKGIDQKDISTLLKIRIKNARVEPPGKQHDHHGYGEQKMHESFGFNLDLIKRCLHHGTCREFREHRTAEPVSQQQDKGKFLGSVPEPCKYGRIAVYCRHYHSINILC